jgi:dihydroflavonol-4-reductase
MKVLVTGGTGFVGRNLVHYLWEQGYDVTVLHRETSRLHDLPEKISLRTGDLTRPDTIAGCCEGMDWVFHVAGEVTWGKAGKKHMFRINVNGTQHIAEEALKSGVKKFIHTSSAAAVGLPFNEIADESYPFNGDRLKVGYSMAKKAGEEVVLQYVKKGLNATIVNPTVILGRRNYASNFVRSVLQGRLFVAPEGGMNVCDVDDVAKGHLMAALHGKKGERYLLGGTNLPLRELFQRIIRLAGSNRTVYPVPAPLVKGVSWLGEGLSWLIGKEPPFAWDLAKLTGRTIYYSSQKAVRELGYRATPLDETLQKVLEWEKRQQSHADFT